MKEEENGGDFVGMKRRWQLRVHRESEPLKEPGMPVAGWSGGKQGKG